MDFVNDTPTSPYGLALELMGVNYGGPWNRVAGLVTNRDQRIAHNTNVYFDPNGFTNTAFPTMPGDVRDFGWGW
jgi:hypothetical protein